MERGIQATGPAVLSSDRTPVAEHDVARWFDDNAGDDVDAIELRLGLLEGFELTCGRRTIELSSGSERLLAFLAIANRPLMRNYIAFSLWPDKDEGRAFGNLRSTIWRLRQAGLGLIESAGQRMRLGREVMVDLHSATLVAQRLLDGHEPLDWRRVQAVLTAGDLLDDWYEPWLAPERERLRQMRLRALEALSTQLLRAGDVTGAIETGLAAVAAEPLRESAHRVVINAHLAEGNHAEALRQYEAYRLAASSELGVLPSEALERLVQPIGAVPTVGRR